MTLVLHAYSNERLEEQQETLEQLVEIKRIWGDRVISQFCNDTDDYWATLLRIWGKDDLIIVEQDVVATPLHILSLAACSRFACAYPYRLRAGQLSIWDMIDDLKHGEFREYIPDYYEIALPTFCDGTSLGLTKLTTVAQKLVPLWKYDVEKYKWWYLDSFISWHLYKHSQKIHIHLPEVKHNRKNELEVKIGDQSIFLTE